VLPLVVFADLLVPLRLFSAERQTSDEHSHGERESTSEPDQNCQHMRLLLCGRSRVVSKLAGGYLHS
jgi:hypothetical protein